MKFIRAGITGKDPSAILDLGSRPNEFHSVSFGFIRARPGPKIAVKDLSAILDLGSWIPPE